MAFRRRNKSYPFFSQEFLIQNHADIVFSLVIFILIGLMFEVRFSFFLPPSSLSAQLFVEAAERFTDVTWRERRSLLRRKVSIPFLQTCSSAVIPCAQTLRAVCVCAMAAWFTFPPPTSSPRMSLMRTPRED